MSKKNIDKLFHEKLSDFKEIPDEKVWSSISDSLDKKKSRKGIPFWWKLGGVAALIAAVLIVINPFKEDYNTAPIISDTEKLEKVKSNDSESENLFQEKTEETIQLADTETSETEKINSEDLQDNGQSNTVNNAKSSNDSSRFKNIEKRNSQLTNVESEKENPNKDAQESVQNAVNSNDLIESAEILKDKDAVAIKENQAEKPEENSLEKNLNLEDAKQEGLAKVSEENVEKELLEEDKKKSIFDEIEKQAEEEDALVENSKNKWSVGANLAPVYFNSFGEGSPIDPAFNSNSKSGEFNLSYGLSVAYDVTNKLSVRTGVNKVDFGYNTNEIEFSASLQGSLSSRLNNVNYSESAENVVVGSKSQNNFALADRSSDVVSNDISRNGVMAQEFGYIEIPVELDYALVESRFGVNLIGGVSTLFLTNNSVVLNDANETIELGEANNINNINFSTNVGFGLNYKFSSKVRLNVEPVFKYQLGTFSDTSGSFNPFSIGVYSGLNFKF